MLFKKSGIVALCIVIVFAGMFLCFKIFNKNNNKIEYNNEIEYKNEKYNLTYKYINNKGHILSWDIDSESYYRIKIKNSKNGKEYFSSIFQGAERESLVSPEIPLEVYFEDTLSGLENDIYTIVLQKGIYTGKDDSNTFKLRINENEFEVIDESSINDIVLNFLDKPKSIKYKNNILSWDSVKNANAYNIHIYNEYGGDPVLKEELLNIKEYKRNKINISKYLKNAKERGMIHVTITPIDTTNKYYSLSCGKYSFYNY